MKKFLSIFAAVALVFAMASCEEPVEEPNNNGGGNNTEQPGGNEGGGNTEQPGGNEGGNTEQPGGNEGGNTDSDYACLNGSDYYLISMDAVTYESIKNKVVADIRTDDYNTHLWIWDNTYVAGSCSGPNYFGEVEGWISLNVGTIGWSGAGFCCYNADTLAKLTTITTSPADYTFHIALKSQDDAVHTLVFYSNDGSESKIEIGTPTSGHVYNYERNGEWCEIEVPMTYLTGQGLLWAPGLGAGSVAGDNVTTTPTGGHNVMAVLSGATGALNLDACFIYKPAK
ncbi:MAG: hypothetical protein IJZ09_02330 [Tidjanibacter sp.]|nr:hypothetical protein [Tidjanibacter sp.]